MSTREVFRLLIQIPWIVFLIYWIIGAIKTRATREQESLASRLAILLIESSATCLYSIVHWESDSWGETICSS